MEHLAHDHPATELGPSHGTRATRDFARSCQTPILVMPDDTPSHPLQTSMDIVALAPKAEVTRYPWVQPEEARQQAIQQVREFLQANRP